MRHAILTDIHANLPALRAVLEDVSRADVDAIVCLGDIVGYAADPGACVRAVRALDATVLMGNHDHYLVAPEPAFLSAESGPLGRSNPVIAGIRHARTQVAGDDLAWLAARPASVTLGTATFAHAALHGDLTDWPYLLTVEDARFTLRALEGRVGFFGHTHVEKFFGAGTCGSERRAPGVHHLPPESRPCAFTIGAVGQPRSRDPRARWAIWDDEASVVTLRRTAYDIAAAAHAILDAGLPLDSALRLFAGEPVDPSVLDRLDTLTPAGSDRS